MSLGMRLGSLFGQRQDEEPTFALPEDLKRRRDAARKLLDQAGDTSPIQHWSQGAARILGGVRGAIEDYSAGNEEKRGSEAARLMAAQVLGLPGLPATTPAAAPMPGPMNVNPQAGPVATPAAMPAMGGGSLAGIDDRYTPEEARKELAAWNENGRPDTLTGLNPQKAVRLAAMLEDNPYQESIGINSGYRGVDTQKRLWDAAVAKYGSEAEARKWVAPPGKSQHGQGNAVDLAFDDPRAKDWAHANASKYGLAFPLKHEPWHVELAGARGQPQTAAAPATPAPATGQAPSSGRALALMASPAFAYLPPGTQAAIKIAAERESPDPIKQQLTLAQLEAARLANAETRRKADTVEREYKEAPDGTVYEREKGSDSPWKKSLQLGTKPDAPKFRELNGRVYQEMPDGSLQDRTPQGVVQGYTPMTPDQRKAYNVPDGTPAFMGPDGKPQFGPASRAEQGEFGKAADKQMAEYFKTHADGGTQAANVLNSMEVLREVGQAAPQGGVQGRIASAFPGFSTNADVFNSQVKTIAPQLRVPGSGATSDKDLDTFMAALPNLKNTPEANKAILGIVETKAQLNLERAEISRKALRREIPAEEADKQLRELDKRSILTPEVRLALGIKGTAATNRSATPGSGPRILSVEPVK